MKKYIIVLAILASVFMCFANVALCDTIMIDTDTATPDEILEAINALKKLYDEKTMDMTGLPQTVTFENGFKISVDGYNVDGNTLTVDYTFTHQDDRPLMWMGNVVCYVYQQGLMLGFGKFELENTFEMAHSVLSGGELKLKLSYVLTDKSDITIYLQPVMSQEYKYIKFSIE